MIIFPGRDLPSLAEDWGRSIENEIRRIDSDISAVGASAGNSSRFAGGQLAVQSRLIDEQMNRSTLSVSPANLSVSGSATVEPFPRANRSFSFPTPPRNRLAQVEVYADWNLAGSPGDVSVMAYLSYAGEIVSRLDRRIKVTSPPALGSAPSSYDFSGLATVPITGDSAASFTLTAVRVGFTSTSSTETLTNIRAFLTPFQSV